MHVELACAPTGAYQMGASMHKPALRGLAAAIVLILLATAAARADSVAVVTSLGGLGANDTIVWSQLGADATDLTATPTFTSTHGLTGSVIPDGSEQPGRRGMPETLAVGILAGPHRIHRGRQPDLDGGYRQQRQRSAHFELHFEERVGRGRFHPVRRPGSIHGERFRRSTAATSLGSVHGRPVIANGDATFIGVLDTPPPTSTNVTFSITSCTRRLHRLRD